MLRSVVRDGPRAAALSLLAVVGLIIVLVHGARAKFAAVATVLVGVLWMIGAAGLQGVRITFLNFIALPITFGVGGEYALNVVARWRREGSMPEAVGAANLSVVHCWRATNLDGPALMRSRPAAERGFAGRGSLVRGGSVGIGRGRRTA